MQPAEFLLQWDVTHGMSIFRTRTLRGINSAADPDFPVMEELGMETPKEHQPQP